MNLQEQVRQDEPLDPVRYERPQLERTVRLAEVTGEVKVTGNFVVK
jgi:hypothetical protein